MGVIIYGPKHTMYWGVPSLPGGSVPFTWHGYYANTITFLQTSRQAQQP